MVLEKNDFVTTEPELQSSKTLWDSSVRYHQNHRKHTTSTNHLEFRIDTQADVVRTTVVATTVVPSKVNNSGVVSKSPFRINPVSIRKKV